MVFLTKRHVSRRTLLRGIGAGIALPLLDAMIPAGVALAQTAAVSKPRMGFFYLPHGAVMDQWTPTVTGKDYALSPILKPFEKVRSHMTVISGLDNKPAHSSSVHAITPGTWLGCVAPHRTHVPFGGITVDQFAAAKIGQDTPLPSMEVAVEEAGGTAACDGVYGCSFGKTIAFRTPTAPLPMETRPRKLFERMFGRGSSETEREAINSDFRSILDMVSEETAALSRKLGAGDRATLATYLESVREMERRVDRLGERRLDEADLPELPPGLPEFDEHVRLMFDLIAMAYQADVTRITTFMMAAEVSNQAYTHIGIADAFHPLSHHNNNPAALEKLARLQTYHSERFAEFLQKLAAIPDGEASVLDSSIFLYGSNMSDSNRHNHFPLPTVVFGKGGGIKGGTHLRFPDHTPLANLHLTLLRRAGIETKSFGDSTAELSEV